MAKWWCPDSNLVDGCDLKTRVGQCLNDAFCNLFGFFRVYLVVRMIFVAIANCCRNQ